MILGENTDFCCVFVNKLMPATIAHVVLSSLPFREIYHFLVVNPLLRVVRVGPVEEPFGTTKPSFVYDLSAKSAARLANHKGYHLLICLRHNSYMIRTLCPNKHLLNQGCHRYLSTFWRKSNRFP